MPMCVRARELLSVMSAHVYAHARENGMSSKMPDVETLEAWMDEGGCEATDGCWVEPDGVCPHGKKSWLLVAGMI